MSGTGADAQLRLGRRAGSAHVECRRCTGSCQSWRSATRSVDQRRVPCTSSQLRSPSRADEVKDGRSPPLAARVRRRVLDCRRARRFSRDGRSARIVASLTWRVFFVAARQRASSLARDHARDHDRSLADRCRACQSRSRSTRIRTTKPELGRHDDRRSRGARAGAAPSRALVLPFAATAPPRRRGQWCPSPR